MDPHRNDHSFSFHQNLNDLRPEARNTLKLQKKKRRSPLGTNKI